MATWQLSLKRTKILKSDLVAHISTIKIEEKAKVFASDLGRMYSFPYRASYFAQDDFEEWVHHFFQIILVQFILLFITDTITHQSQRGCGRWIACNPSHTNHREDMTLDSLQPITEACPTNHREDVDTGYLACNPSQTPSHHWFEQKF